MKDSNRHLHIAFAFDQNFIIPTHVLLTSIFLNNKDVKFHFHVIATGLSSDEIKGVTGHIEKNGCSVTFYTMDEKQVEGFVIGDYSHLSVATYYRLFLPSMISEEVSKLLYLDVDIIVNGDLVGIFETPLHDKPLAAVVDSKVGPRPELGIPEKDNCFNAGVLLINLAEWKKQEISNKALRYLTEYRKNIIWHDQDALNAVLRNNWYRLDKKYNVTFYDIPEYLPSRKFQSFLKSKVIIHYTTQNKPWLLTCTNRFKFVYHHYLKQTPHLNQEKYLDFRMKKKYRYRLWRLRLKEQLIDFGVMPILKRMKLGN